MVTKTHVTLPNGDSMPILGFGTWQASEEEIESAIDAALEAGYRHIDTAPVYENEAAIGRALKKWLDSEKISRKELFIVTKLPPVGNRPGGPEKWINKSLKALQLDYLDLFLIHTPFSFEEVGDELHPMNEKGAIRLDHSTDHLKVWKEMEDLVTAGLARSIGLSNFNSEQIKRIQQSAKVPVSNLQIELHVYFQQKQLVSFCQANNITVTAYAPLGSRGLVKILGKTDVLPDLLSNSVVAKIAKKHQKTPAQILLKHIIQKGIAAIPKSTNRKRIHENIQLFKWELDQGDIDALDSVDAGEGARVCDFSFLKGVRTHPEFPF